MRNLETQEKLFFSAIKRDDLDQVKSILNNGFDLNACYLDALKVAGFENARTIIEFLLTLNPHKDTVVSLTGKTFDKVYETSTGKLMFESKDFCAVFYHEQDCCETVTIEDICGDLEDLEGVPLLRAEVITEAKENDDDNDEDGGTWSFYKFDTIKGSVTIRWYGTSNGCYSEEVDIKLFDMNIEEEKNEWEKYK